tara:strand:+ start:577 stop:798 length:222 start_codon:yes stop_codon:yes gene_type:complete
MIFNKKGMWKHSLSSKKFSTESEALAAYNLLVGEPVVEEPPLLVEEFCPVCNGEECRCDLSPLEKLWKSADPT